MPQITNVVVTNLNTGVTWTTGQQATVIPARVLCNAVGTNQPPVGFVNNPHHTFSITGRIMPSGEHYSTPAGGLHADPGHSEPPHVYAFA